MTILEFNENQQAFHYNEIRNGIPHDEINSYEWKPLLTCKDDYQAGRIADFLERQFIDRNIKLTVEEAIYTVANLHKFLSTLNAWQEKD